jgi:hypothetical protein
MTRQPKNIRKLRGSGRWPGTPVVLRILAKSATSEDDS